MRYSIVPPAGASPIWTIIDERDDVVFAGHKQQCEEWLDLADFAETAGCLPTRQLSDEVTNRVTTDISKRLPIFELATALLHRF